MPIGCSFSRGLQKSHFQLDPTIFMLKSAKNCQKRAKRAPLLRHLNFANQLDFVIILKYSSNARPHFFLQWYHFWGRHSLSSKILVKIAIFSERVLSFWNFWTNLQELCFKRKNFAYSFKIYKKFEKNLKISEIL